MGYPQLYRASLEEAKARGETEIFRASHKMNAACKRAVEAAIRENFDGLRLNKDCLKPVMEEYGSDRLEWVLANTLRQEGHDGRFSRENKKWAAAVPVPESSAAGYDLRRDFVVGSHPAVLDGFINIMRREQAAKEEAERKPSIKGQLSVLPDSGGRPAERKTGREVR